MSDGVVSLELIIEDTAKKQLAVGATSGSTG